METSRKWLLAACVVIALGGTALVVDIASSHSAAAAEREPAGDHWRNHDGHWSFWHDGDKRWYYTDGTHWFYNDGKNWVLYRFDKAFGRTGFVHGDYKVPGPEVKIALPRHKVDIRL